MTDYRSMVLATGAVEIPAPATIPPRHIVADGSFDAYHDRILVAVIGGLAESIREVMLERELSNILRMASDARFYSLKQDQFERVMRSITRGHV